MNQKIVFGKLENLKRSILNQKTDSKVFTNADKRMLIRKVDDTITSVKRLILQNNVEVQSYERKLEKA